MSLILSKSKDLFTSHVKISEILLNSLEAANQHKASKHKIKIKQKPLPIPKVKIRGHIGLPSLR